MPRVPYNSVGGFSTGLTMTGVIDSTGNITGVGATFSGNVTTQSVLYTDDIQSIGLQLSLSNIASSRVSIGDLDANGNSIYIFIRNNAYILDLSNPYGDIRIGDPNAIDNGVYITYNSSSGNLDGGGSYLTNFSSASFTGLLTASAGISAAGGVTFSGTVASDTGYRITSNAIKALTGTTYTFIAADNGDIVTFNNGSTITVTVPTGLPVGFNCTAIQLGTGAVGFTAASGVTLNAYSSAYKIAGQHGSASLISYATNVFNLSGSLNP